MKAKTSIDIVIVHPSRPRVPYWVALVMLFAPIACIPDSEKNPTDGYAVGLLLPFTGGDASYGSSYERAAVMARDVINEAGGVNGKPIYFITRDTHSDVKRAMKSLDEILAENPVAVIGPEGAEIAREALPKLEKAGVLFVSPMVSGASSVEVTPEFPWIRLAPSPAIMGRAFANYLRSEQEISVVSAVGSDEEYNRDFIETFQARFEQLGGEVEVAVTLDTDKLSYIDEVQRLSLGNTRNVVLAASTKIGARFVNDLTISRQVETERWKWFLSPSLETPIFLQNTVWTALEGALGIGIDVDDPAEEFIADFETRWNDTPREGPFFYYDALAILALSMEKAIRDDGELSYEGLRDGVIRVTVPSGNLVGWQQIEEGLAFIRDDKSVYYSGLTGTLLFDELGQQQKAAMATWTVKNGQIEAPDTL